MIFSQSMVEILSDWWMIYLVFLVVSCLRPVSFIYLMWWISSHLIGPNLIYHFYRTIPRKFSVNSFYRALFIALNASILKMSFPKVRIPLYCPHWHEWSSGFWSFYTRFMTDSSDIFTKNFESSFIALIFRKARIPILSLHFLLILPYWSITNGTFVQFRISKRNH